MENNNLQLLLSIMNESNPIIYLKQNNILFNYIIINQITKKNVKPINISQNNNMIISVNEKGLSKSRNLALKNASMEFALLSDDDILYFKNTKKIIIDSFNKYPQADIIAFFIKSEDKNMQKKDMKIGKIGFLKSLKVYSVQIAFRVSSIKEKNIFFDERFGSGSKYCMGEENIFLSDCLKKGLKVYYVPKTIGFLKNVSESSWFNGYDKDYFISKGAVFYRINKTLCFLLIFQFAIRKYKKYKKDISFVNAIKCMIAGVNEIKKEALI